MCRGPRPEAGYEDSPLDVAPSSTPPRPTPPARTGSFTFLFAHVDVAVRFRVSDVPADLLTHLVGQVVIFRAVGCAAPPANPAPRTDRAHRDSPGVHRI